MKEARRTGSLVGESFRTTLWQPLVCGTISCTLELVSTGWLIRGIDNKRQIRDIFMANPSIPVHADKTPFLCPFHQTLTNPTEHFKAILWEDVHLRGAFLHLIFKNLPYLLITVTDKEGNVTNRLKDEVVYDWSFDAQRNLRVLANGFPIGVKASLLELATDPQFAGKVIIDG